MTALSTHFISNEGTVRRVYIANIAPWNVLRSTIVCTDFIAVSNLYVHSRSRNSTTFVETNFLFTKKLKCI